MVSLLYAYLISVLIHSVHVYLQTFLVELLLLEVLHKILSLDFYFG